jgi:hypothetical protein
MYRYNTQGEFITKNVEKFTEMNDLDNLATTAKEMKKLTDYEEINTLYEDPKYTILSEEQMKFYENNVRPDCDITQADCHQKQFLWDTNYKKYKLNKKWSEHVMKIKMGDFSFKNNELSKLQEMRNNVGLKSKIFFNDIISYGNKCKETSGKDKCLEDIHSVLKIFLESEQLEKTMKIIIGLL